MPKKQKLRKKELQLGKNLNYLLKINNLDIKQLSNIVDLPATTIARMRYKDINPTLSSLEPLADFFREDINTLLYSDMSTPEFQIKKQSGEFTHIPIFNLDALKDGNKSTKYHKFVGVAGIGSSQAFGIEIQGDSLLPIFQNDSILVINPDLTPKESDYILCSLGNEGLPIVRQIFFDGKNTFLKPLNPCFGDIEKHENLKVLGVIVKSIGSFR